MPFKIEPDSRDAFCVIKGFYVGIKLNLRRNLFVFEDIGGFYNGRQTQHRNIGTKGEDDIDKAKKIMADILSGDNRIFKDPAPQIAVVELADSSVNFIVRPWVKSDDYWDVYFDTTENIKKSFDAEGISIPYPQRDVHVYKHKE
jgi:hypothetical protein